MSKCGLVFNEHKMFVVSAFVKMGLVSAPFGAYFGILYDAAYYGGTQITHSITLALAFKRFVILGIVIIPITFPFFYISSANHVWVLYLFKVSMPFFLATFAMFAFAKPIFKKFGLDHAPTSPSLNPTKASY